MLLERSRSYFVARTSWSGVAVPAVVQCHSSDVVATTTCQLVPVVRERLQSLGSVALKGAGSAVCERLRVAVRRIRTISTPDAAAPVSGGTEPASFGPVRCVGCTTPAGHSVADSRAENGHVPSAGGFGAVVNAAPVSNCFTRDRSLGCSETAQVA